MADSQVDAQSIHVQVCFASPDVQFLRDLQMPQGATVHEAIIQSGILVNMPEIDLTICRVGIYSKLKTLDTQLRENDRVEVYRSLMSDPKESRRVRAEKKNNPTSI